MFSQHQCRLGVLLILLPTAVRLPQAPFFLGGGARILSKRTKNIKTFILPKLLCRFQPNFAKTKEVVFFVGGPNTWPLPNKSKVADGRHREKSTIAISQQRLLWPISTKGRLLFFGMRNANARHAIWHVALKIKTIQFKVSRRLHKSVYYRHLKKL